MPPRPRRQQLALPLPLPLLLVLWSGIAASVGEARLPLADECWDYSFTFWRCCLGNARCWDGYYTRERCCYGIDYGETERSAWEVVDSPRVACVLQAPQVIYFQRAATRPDTCPESRRFFYAAQGRDSGYQLAFQPWWQDKKPRHLIYRDFDKWMFRSVHDMGGLCVPSVCDLDTVARWLLPLFRREAGTSMELFRSSLSQGNSTHVRMPAPGAVRPLSPHQLDNTYAFRGKADPSVEFTFLLWEHLSSPSLGAQSSRILLAVLLLSIVTALSTAATSVFATSSSGGRGLCSVFSLQQNVQRLVTSRGSQTVDVFRVLLTLLVVSQHTGFSAFGPWEEQEMPVWLHMLSPTISRVNVMFTSLFVYLQARAAAQKKLVRQSSGEDAPRSGLASLTWSFAARLLQRWLSLAPTVAVWTMVFAECFMDGGLPVNNLLRNDNILIWFGARRETCRDRSTLWASLLLVHTLVFPGHASLCHIADIYETYFHLDAILLLLWTFVGHEGLLSALALPGFALAVGRNAVKLRERGYSGGTGHRLSQQLPAACAAVVASQIAFGILPARRSSDGTATFCRFRPWCIFLLGAVGVAVSLCEGGLRFTAGLPTSFCHGWAGVVQAQGRGEAAGYVPWCHAWEVPLVLGFILCVHSLSSFQDAARWQSSEVGGSERARRWVSSALANLSMGANMSHFVLQLHLKTFVRVQAVEPSVLNFAVVLVVHIVAGYALSLLVFLLLQAPIANLCDQCRRLLRRR